MGRKMKFDGPTRVATFRLPINSNSDYRNYINDCVELKAKGNDVFELLASLYSILTDNMEPSKQLTQVQFQVLEKIEEVLGK